MKSIILFIIVLILIGTGLALMMGDKEETTSEIVVSGECFVKSMPFGSNMSFSEADAGVYTYTIYPTENGVEVWKLCN